METEAEAASANVEDITETPGSVKSDDSSPPHESGRGSPPPKCAICLGTCRNKSFTDSCLHQFCFKCLLTWSKVKAVCPLCKQNFRSIIHNVRSNHQYEEYMVEQQQQQQQQSVEENIQRFRYRTTLTLPRATALSALMSQLRRSVVELTPTATAGWPMPARSRRPPSFRCTVYRHNLWARPLPDFTGRYRDCSPQFYRYNSTQMHRLVPWLNRELHYLLNENIGHISYVLTRILELLPQYYIRSQEFREAMQPYFGDKTVHFLHELHCFASTPYDITGYDRNVQYTTDTRISTMVSEVLSSSESEASADSDIVVVSSAPGPSRPPPQPSVIPIETISHSDTDDSSSEVMVVGYIKPPQERTPEVVDLLGSDSDVILQEEQPDVSQPTTSQLNLVKLSLKRHRSPAGSDSDESYRPPSYQPPSRRRNKRSRGSVSTSDTSRDTPSSPCTPPLPPGPSNFTLPPPFYSESSPSDTVSDTSSPSLFGSDDQWTPDRKKKSRKRTEERRRSKKRINKHKDKKRSKRKSHSGKGVKTSKLSTPTPEPQQQQQAEEQQQSEQAGPSGRDPRRLKSVVNVMYRNTPDLSPSGHSSNSLSSTVIVPAVEAKDECPDIPMPLTTVDQDSDSQDNLPLNLSILKSSPFSEFRL